ncbi:MAG: mandelate racemase/muconate lactonizing enzyme family protein [Bryobacterales bacterium]
MKIQSYSTRAVSLTDRPLPIANSPGARMANFATLTLRTDEGIEGIGYAGFVPSCVLKGLHETLNGLAELAVGDDPFEIEAIAKKLLELAGAGAPAGFITRAAAAIDVALWDIRGKALGKPVYQLLGGFRDRVPVYASGYLWRTYDLNMLAEWGAKLVEQGFRAMKLRMGAEDAPAKEIERLRVLREAVGPAVDLMVDINQGWDVNQSISIGRALEQFNLYWLEDPTHHLDYNGLARIAAALDTPLAAGEYVYGLAPFAHLIERQSIDIVMIDLLRAGGLTPFMKAAHLAEANNLPVVSHLAPEILCHALAAVPNGLYLEHMPWSFGLFKEVPVVENGQLVLSQKPGLGLEFA